MAAKEKKKKEKKEEEPLFVAPQYVSQTLHNFNHDCVRLMNVHFVDEYTFITAVGNTVQFIDITTKRITWINGQDGGGIGAVCVHPGREGPTKAARYFAVAEKTGLQSAPLPNTPLPKPRVYIYEYPTKKLFKTLKEGTEQLYTACAFSARGDKLATVGGSTDFMLTVWNWQQEAVILRFKAWGSEVFRVTFNQYDDGFLTTSGVGHMKFWEMAKTFTGLKLKGDIGKFGKVDIQDVSGYAELPDGKVLSGSESGMLLLWEAFLIKTEVGQPDGVPCHKGPIEVVVLLEEPGETEEDPPNRIFMSAGHDGFMRYWRFGEIDMADTTDDKPVFEAQCVREVLIDKNCCIKAVTKGASYWLIQDSNGAFWKTKLLSYAEIVGDADCPEPEEIMRFHAGPIMCVQASPNDHTCITGGADGTLRLWDYLQRRELYSMGFSAGVSFLQWLPEEVEATCSTVVAGFDNGLVRVLQRTKEDFALCTVWKPHTRAVNAVAFSPDYKWAASVSKDGTIFFFQIKDVVKDWVPVGQSKLPHEATCAHWDSAARCVLGLVNGDIIGVHCPDPASIDPEVTYVFECTYTQLPYHQRVRPREKEKKKGALADLDDLGADPDEDEEEEEEEAAPAPEDIGPFPVNDMIRMPEDLGGKLVVAMRHNESTYDYAGLSWPQEGMETEAEYPISNVSYFKTTVRKMQLSSKRNFLIMGCEDGQIMLRDAQGRGASPLKKVWHIPLAHDGRRDPPRQGGNVHCGSVTGVATSFDESVLLSVSMDGSFFAYLLGDVHAESQEPPQPPAPVTDVVWADGGHRCPDLTAVDALSVQEKKVKDDEDRARIAAERKRMSLRDKVRELQEKYEAIVHENARAEKGKQVSKEDLQLDPEITALLHQENDRRVAEVVERFAWETEKAELSRKKLEDTFLKRLRVERIMLYAFRSGKCVSSFRTPELTERQTERIERVHALIHQEEQRRAAMHRDPTDAEPSGSPAQLSGLSPASPGGAGQPSSASPRSFAAGDDGADQEAGDAMPLGEGGRTESSLQMTQKSKSKKEEKPQPKSQLEKAEERKKERADRKARFDALLDRKPQADHEDPRDLQQIQRAERNMGDRKLKNDESYEMKEHERVTAEPKERQLILLEESINTLRMDFNDRFLAMRDLKERLTTNINRDLKQIEKINKQLAAYGGAGKEREEKIELFSMRDQERPDKLRAEPPTKEELARYQREQEKAERKRAKMARAAAGGDVLAGSDSDDDDKPAEDAVVGDKAGQGRKTSLARFPRRESAVITAQMRYNIEMQGRLDNIQKSALEEEEDTIRKIQLEYEKGKLQRKIDKTIATFDEALDELRREKFKLEGDLKMADMRVLLLYRELVLLKAFNKEDEEQTRQLEKYRAEKHDVTLKNNECQEKLNDKKIEIQRLLEREQQIMSEMQRIQALAPPEARDQLMKIFRRKVKRKGKREGDGDEEEEEEEEESSSEDVWGDDDDDASPEDEEDACPEGCDEDTYQQVLDLRARRLDQEDIVNDFQKSIEQLKKENNDLAAREKKTNRELQKVEAEIDKFQKKKQRDLNQLETVVVLKLNQVRCLDQETHKVPADQNNLVVFTNGGMNELHNRILQLQNDKKALKKEYDQLKKIHRGLNRDKKQAEELVKQWEQRVYEVQLLKFGQKVDLESLEDVSVDRQTEELKMRLRAEEIKWERAMKVQQHALKKLKERQQQVTTQNSNALQQLANLRQDQQRLEGQLNVSQNKILTRMAGGSRVATASDRANLKDLVVMQQREIDALKNEVAMLRRKGGHVYTPVVSKVVTQADAARGPDDKGASA